MEDIYVIEHIKELCEQRNISYYKLAQLSGIPLSSLSTMLNKQHIPSMRNLIKICNGLNITLAQFFSESGKDLTPDQSEILSLWNLLDKESQISVRAYMYGLAHKTPPLKTRDENDEIQ